MQQQSKNTVPFAKTMAKAVVKAKAPVKSPKQVSPKKPKNDQSMESSGESLSKKKK